jgi:hypothetical protein
MYLIMSDYLDYLKVKKIKNDTLYNMSVLQKNFDTIFKENFELKIQIKALEENIKKNKDINDMRFGEVYAFLSKVEKTYYNGLFNENNDNHTTANTTHNEDVKEAQINKNLFGNMSILKNNESLFIHTKDSDLDTMKKIFL